MAILEIGISVFSAAITTLGKEKITHFQVLTFFTLGAACLLLLTTVLFFVRFGLFVFFTISLSFLFAFVSDFEPIEKENFFFTQITLAQCRAFSLLYC